MERFRKCQFLNCPKAGGHQVGSFYLNKMKELRKWLSNSKDEGVPLSLLELLLQLCGVTQSVCAKWRLLL